MRGAIPPLPNAPSWCGAQFKKSTGTALSLPYVYSFNNCHRYSIITFIKSQLSCVNHVWLQKHCFRTICLVKPRMKFVLKSLTYTEEKDQKLATLNRGQRLHAKES